MDKKQDQISPSGQGDTDAEIRVLHGPVSSYDDKGRLKTGIEFKKGKVDGKMLVYNENGQAVQHSRFGDDMLNGLSAFYDDRGLLIMKANFLNGRLHGLMTVYEEGLVQAEFNYVNGVREGRAVHYNLKTGQPSGTQQYKNDKPDGKAVWYDEEGNLLSETMFRQGKMEGEKRDYYKNGQIMLQSFYVADKLHGTATGYFENGHIREKKEFRDGKQVGKTLEFNKNWKKKKEDIFVEFSAK